MPKKRLIDANALNQRFTAMQECANMRDHVYLMGVLSVIDKAPTIDAVEVVRCKDCKYREDELKCPMCFDEWDEDEPGFLRIDKTVDDGFCHMGAKMDGGAEG